VEYGVSGKGLSGPPSSLDADADIPVRLPVAALRLASNQSALLLL
jgi:hypothetical protein